ncbi:ATPase [Aquabacterium lacunae]|uniref:ATPase n=1 Tax=Aquabacterium lacunae TaxID=2528630 RepID=A0A4Q9GXC3_9BURK|nr:XrtA/PEP-CTERM system-associated ATPase [Aquabacterium lacunae]TBO30247.1 ATPase [Aquabacterium lacunae]
MYESFFGLSSKPFQLNPDPTFYFGSKPHRRARAYLEYGVMRAEGFIVITGEVGAGKTTVVRSLLDSIDPKAVVAAQLVSTQLGADDTLRMVGAAFGVRVRDVNKAELLMALEAFFITQATLGKRCLLIVDEAQNLKPQAVEELRMLSNFQHGNRALLQTFLVGQPEFRNILLSPEMLQLRQRVTASCHLGAMAEDETRGYIEHRLKRAGSTGKPSFDVAVFATIHEYTGGLPRRINTLCDRVLLSAFLAGESHVSAAMLASVIEELHEEQSWLSEIEGDPSQAMPAVAESTSGDAAPHGTVPRVAGAVAADGLPSASLAAQMARIERSLLRQEKLSLELMAALKKLQEKQ